MTDAQSFRWEKQRSSGRPRYVLKRTLLYGAIIPSLIIWAAFQWTTFGKFVILLILLSIPVDYALARISWIYQEYRYSNYKHRMILMNKGSSSQGPYEN
jgi:hypothetical protein